MKQGADKALQTHGSGARKKGRLYFRCAHPTQRWPIRDAYRGYDEGRALVSAYCLLLSLLPKLRCGSSVASRRALVAEPLRQCPGFHLRGDLR